MAIMLLLFLYLVHVCQKWVIIIRQNGLKKETQQVEYPVILTLKISVIARIQWQTVVFSFLKNECSWFILNIPYFMTGHLNVYLLYNVSKCVCICKVVLVYDLWSGIIDITWLTNVIGLPVIVDCCTRRQLSLIGLPVRDTSSFYMCACMCVCANQ